MAKNKFATMSTSELRTWMYDYYARKQQSEAAFDEASRDELLFAKTLEARKKAYIVAIAESATYGGKQASAAEKLLKGIVDGFSLEGSVEYLLRLEAAHPELCARAR